MRKPISFFVSFALCALFISCEVTEAPTYSIVIDAGSSGSRIYIYSVAAGGNESLPVIEAAVDAKKVEPGLSEMDTSPDEIIAGLEALIEYAKSHIDQAYWASTPLNLMATAGMRLETPSQQEATMAKVTEVLQASPFDFKKAIILSGQYEGLYAWIAINYLDDAFDPNQERESMMEMGGASTQIAYLNEDANSAAIKRTYLGQSYDIFAKSYLLMGQDQAFKLTNTPNCFPVGYEIGEGQTGQGNFEACSQDIITKFESICPDPGDPECIFNKGFEASEDEVYLAISAYFYTFDFFEFADGQMTLNGLLEKGSRFCGLSWEEIKNHEEYKGTPEKYLSTYCFYASYFWSLLGKGYQLENDLKVRYSNYMNGKEPSWTLGAALDLLQGHEPEAYINP